MRDGLSVLLVLLTCFLGLLAVLASWTEVQERVGLFHANVLWVLAGVIAQPVPLPQQIPPPLVRAKPPRAALAMDQRR